MTEPTAAARIVQWTTGLVARQAVRAIVERPDLELVGAYAFSAEKVGSDVGDLVGLGRQLGITATDDIDALIALRPDCVVYMPLHPDVADMTRLLHAGVNIATTSWFVTGRALGADALGALDDAAREGGASLFGSGIHPGHTDYLAAIASGICRSVRSVRILESADLSLWAADPNQDELGWGRPAGDPGHAEDLERATAIDIDSLDLLAQLFGVALDDVRFEVEFAHATTDLDIPGRSIRRGHVAGIDIRWIGTSGGADIVEVNLRWTLGTDLDPAWGAPEGFVFEVRGTPCVTLRLDILPDDLDSLPIEEMMAFGQLITAAPVVNAIHSVVAARPGVITYADIPPVVAPLVPRPLEVGAAPK
ncbi:MAG TPA: hypothetical protein VJM33_01990 [Microthrixaceae bacterium]|nr:hypothetical protein [Microthrixaceae bacterium]